MGNWKTWKMNGATCTRSHSRPFSSKTRIRNGATSPGKAKKDDTHAGCGTEEAVEEREEMRRRLHRILQGYRPMDDGVLKRKRSKFYTWYHGIKVYEITYSCVVTETIRETVTAVRPQVSVSVGLL